MTIYISRGRFTSDAVKGMVAKPENREEAVSKLCESVGGKLIGWYLTFGHHDWLTIAEFPDDKAPEVRECCFVLPALAKDGLKSLFDNSHARPVAVQNATPSRSPISAAASRWRTTRRHLKPTAGLFL